MKDFNIKMVCLSTKLERQTARCTINSQHLKATEKMEARNGIIYMITKTHKSKQKGKGGKCEKSSSDLTHSAFWELLH